MPHDWLKNSRYFFIQSAENRFDWFTAVLQVVNGLGGYFEFGFTTLD